MSDPILLDDLINDFRNNVYADCPCTLTFDGNVVNLESANTDAKVKTGTSVIKEITTPTTKLKSKKK